ncbi:uncharacterized protein LOC144628255 isoform X1 [Oculina patagonica]
MRLGLKLSFLVYNSQSEISLLCFMLTLRYVMTTECSFAAVAASKPCHGSGSSITEEQCRQLSDECCVFKRADNLLSKCFRTKKKQPDSGSCRDAPILRSKPVLNQFLESDVTLELKVVSELQCWDYCIRQKDCKAYNYHHAIGQSLKTCQLLSNDVGLPIYRKDYTYHIVNKKGKNIKTLLRSKCH